MDRQTGRAGEIDPRPFKAVLDQSKSKLAQDEARESRMRWEVTRYAVQVSVER